MNIFLDLNLDGKTIIMATHDKNIVDSLDKRVVAFDNREIISDEKR
jgi:cell division transport system ATP-binding protein